MKFTDNKIISGEPNNVIYLFPNCSINEIESLFEDFQDNHLDRALIFKNYFKKETLPTLDELIKVKLFKKNNYTLKVSFESKYQNNKEGSEKYNNTIEFMLNSDKNDIITRNIADQFCTYLWKKEIPVAQNLKE